jgi:hypothetical protein
MTKKIAKTKTRPWDAAEHLTSEDDMAAYLEAALEDGNPALIAAASQIPTIHLIDLGPPNGNRADYNDCYV